jgi:outer membrane biosynthesis protein TonB
MIELKITVDKAVELEQEVKDLYQSIVGTPVKEETPAKKETPKKADPVKEEAPAPKAEPVPTEEPAKAEEPEKEVPSLEATREAVKDVMAKATDKTKAKGEFKAFLDSIGAEKVTSATDEQRIQIMEWVNSRG